MVNKINWRTWRRISQVIFLLTFIYLTAKAQVPQGFNPAVFHLAGGGDLRLSAPIGLFFDLDPLVAIGTMLASWTLKPTLFISLAVLIATMLLGRFFCGFICPFGTLHQFFSWLGQRRRVAEREILNRPSPAHKLKYWLLIGFLGASLVGSDLAGLMDPFSLLFRGLALALFPAASLLVAQVTSLLADASWPFKFVGYIGPMGLDHVLGYGPRVYQGAALLGLLLLVVLVLNVWRPRFFCRCLCPLGALLGLFSRFSLAPLTKDRTKCTDCGRCQAECQGACAPHPDNAWIRPDCLACFNCQVTCPVDALRFRWQPGRIIPEPTLRPPQNAPVMSRRAVLGSVAGGLTVVALSRTSLVAPHRPDSRLVRPPGSLEETEFLKRCVRCGLCMRVCPTNVLSPTLFEAGLEGIWTPVLDFNLGYCEHSCTLCTSVCPTGAIRLITGKEKTQTPIVIGSAFFDRGRCLPWSGQGPCLVCEEVCPVSPKAIYMVPLDTFVDKDRTTRLSTPQVNLARCIGCGTCVNKCPVKGRPAVYVHSVGESRSKTNRILLSNSGNIKSK